MNHFLIGCLIVWMASVGPTFADSGLHTCFSSVTGKSRIFLVEKLNNDFVVKAQVGGQYFSVCAEKDTIRVQGGSVCVYGKRGDAKQIATFFPRQFDEIVDFMVLDGVDVEDQSTWQYKTTTPCVKN